MYTVVIVDDEPWALQGLAEIIDWNNEGFSMNIGMHGRAVTIDSMC